MEPNTLTVRWLHQPIQLFRMGSVGLYPAAVNASRIPAGHPVGFLEAFANIYLSFAQCVRPHLAGKKPKKEFTDFPTIQDCVRGIQYIEKEVVSGKSKAKWTKF